MRQTHGKILLVGGDAELADDLAAQVANGAYEVVHAATASAARELVQSEQPVVMILDLPLWDTGLEGLLGQVVKRIKDSGLPVLIVSEEPEGIHTIEASQEGADDYLAEPLIPREVIAELRAALRRWRVVKQSREPHPPGWPHSMLGAAGIEVNLQSREVQVDARRIEVTPTEFELLRALVERARADEDISVPAQEQQDRGEAEAATRARDEQWDAELAAFLRLRPELQRKYPGKFVAFEDGEVIAVGDTGQETAQEACRATGQIKSRLVRHVDESDDAVDVVHIRLDKPRSVEMETEQ